MTPKPDKDFVPVVDDFGNVAFRLVDPSGVISCYISKIVLAELEGKNTLSNADCLLAFDRHIDRIEATAIRRYRPGRNVYLRYLRDFD